MDSNNDPKTMAKRLREALAERGIELGHGACLECVARQLGHRDWNTLSARAAPATPRNQAALPFPRDWSAAGSRPEDYEMGFDEAVQAAVIRSRDGVAAVGFGTLMQSFEASRYHDQHVKLRAELKTLDVSGAATVWLRVDGASGPIAFDNLEHRDEGQLKGTAEWQARSIVVSVPAHARSISFGFFLKGTGKVWARHFELEESSDETTARPRPNAPANLDFSARI